jgi:DNA-directed RNA polymerase specialized sigma24 family protein
MISDGVENCVQYIDNFDPEKSQNPFAYFTQIIYYAFLRRIQKEKKQLEIKNKILEKSGYDHVMYTESYDGDMAGMNSSYSDMSGIKENLEMRNKR